MQVGEEGWQIDSVSRGTRWLRTLIVLAALAVGAIRFSYEASLPRLVPHDAQGGVWVVYSLVASPATALLLFLALLTLLRAWQRGDRAQTVRSLCLALFVIGWTGCTLLRYERARVALEAADNPSTPPKRLRSLVGYWTGFGYEIDNRLARNPNTPPDVLRLLYEKEQSGTNICLEQNPHTPADILERLFPSGDRYRYDALKGHPAFSSAPEH